MKYLLVVLICITCLNSSAYCPTKAKAEPKKESHTQLVDKINVLHFILI